MNIKSWGDMKKEYKVNIDIHVRIFPLNIPTKKEEFQLRTSEINLENQLKTVCNDYLLKMEAVKP